MTRAVTTPTSRRRVRARWTTSRLPGSSLGELVGAGARVLCCSRGGRRDARSTGSCWSARSASSSIYGAWKTRGVKTSTATSAAAARCAGRRSGSDHGDAGERDHVPLDAGPGLRRRHALRAVLLRPAARDDRDQRRVRARSTTGSRSTRRTSTSSTASTCACALSARVLFLIQRGLAAGITIYAPAIILCAILGWPLQPDHRRSSALVVIVYTVLGRHARGQPDAEAADDRDDGRHGRRRVIVIVCKLPDGRLAAERGRSSRARSTA